jgi:hypothetical protein
MAHRLIFVLENDRWPAEFIDHRNRNRSANVAGNLREATKIENNQNASLRHDNKSGFPNVSWHTRIGKWQAVIRENGRRRHIGYFDTPKLARLAQIGTSLAK